MPRAGRSRSSRSWSTGRPWPEAALNGCRDRPAILHRFPGGVTGEDTEPFYQKRIPKGAPDWVRTATVKFPSGRTASMPVMHDEAALVWAATLGCLECNPWPVRADDVDHPDELRVDLDPTPACRGTTCAASP